MSYPNLPWRRPSPQRLPWRRPSPQRLPSRQELCESLCGGSAGEQRCPPPIIGSVCTQQYDPVCARDVRGLRQTYANSCVACAQPGVQTFREGSCYHPL